MPKIPTVRLSPIISTLKYNKIIYSGQKMVHFIKLTMVPYYFGGNAKINRTTIIWSSHASMK